MHKQCKKEIGSLQWQQETAHKKKIERIEE